MHLDYFILIDFGAHSLNISIGANGIIYAFVILIDCYFYFCFNFVYCAINTDKSYY